MSFLKKAWQKYSSRLGATILHPQFFSYRYLIRDIKSAARHVSGVLIDIGCGLKPYKRFFMNDTIRYYGLDYPNSPESMEDSAHTKPDIYASALNIPLKSACADTVLMTQVLEHVTNPVGSLNEIKRALKAGGKLIISVPMLYPIHSAPYDYFRFTRYGIESLLKECGFTIEKMESAGGATATIALLINLFMMHKLFNLSARKITAPLAIMLAPAVITLAIIINLLAFILQPIDTERKFTTNYFIIARSDL